MKYTIQANTYAIVTGASSGIGQEIAIELAKRKVNLILVARRMERLLALQKRIQTEHSVNVIVKNYDLSSLDNCRLLHKETLEFNPEIIVNNAGFGQIGLFSEIPVEKELEMITLNVESLHLLTKLFLDTMKKGIILNVASMAGFLPTPLMSAYAATKAYVVNLSRAVNYELQKANKPIKVLSLCPGPVETEFGIVANSKQSHKAMKATRCARIAIHGMNRNKPVIVPGLQMKILRFLLRILPTRVVLWGSYKLQKSK